jgi:hypothetical protein
MGPGLMPITRRVNTSSLNNTAERWAGAWGSAWGAAWRFVLPLRNLTPRVTFVYEPSLDFSNPRNSQYLGQVV